jgi:hypothetical protein
MPCLVQTQLHAFCKNVDVLRILCVEEITGWMLSCKRRDMRMRDHVSSVTASGPLSGDVFVSCSKKNYAG